MRGLRALLLVAMMPGLVGACGPHMDRQVALRPQKRELPPMPAGTVPTTGVDRMPSTAEAAALRNPVPSTPETLAEGRRYYGYYCAMCHGNDGKGQTPVGQSYDPRPADLSAASTQALPEGELYRRMLTGKGHEPVMKTTVPPERRWQIVDFVRTLQAPQER